MTTVFGNEEEGDNDDSEIESDKESGGHSSDGAQETMINIYDNKE
jgi:hypothetical protein